MENLWWLERANGLFVAYGRHITSDSRIVDWGAPNLFYYKNEAVAVCREGERPVRVRLIKEVP